VHWRSTTPDQASTSTHVLVPILAEGRRWGALEIAYRPVWERSLQAWLSGGTASLILFMCVAGGLIFYLYLRRVLQHLDPSAAVPQRVRMAFDTLTEGVLILDAQSRIVHTNASFRSLGNAADEDPVGRKPTELPWLAAAVRDDEQEPPWTTALRSHQPVLGRPLTIRHAAGTVRSTVVNAAPVLDNSGTTRGCMVTFNDITRVEEAHGQLLDALADLAASKEQLEARNKELQGLATRDSLTGLLNRRAFFGSFESALRDARQRGLGLACVICDIDSFKDINDRYGHVVGDQVIARIGSILADSVRHTDLVCRYGGEEFCIALPGADAKRAIQLAETVRAKVQAECGAAIPALRGQTVTASFGVSGLEWGAASTRALVDQADQGLYAAKRAGRNRVLDFTEAQQAVSKTADAAMAG
jgi:diguanylate cyclase (GGDEF)-like protein